MKMRIVLCCGFVFAAMLCVGQEAQARTEYNKAFVAKYRDLAEQAKEVKCGLCHGKSKKMRNSYGKAVGAALGAKKVKDMEEITKALTKAEAAKSDVEGKTFGDLIKDGKLPNAK